MPDTQLPLCGSAELVDGGLAVPFDVVYAGQTCRAFAISLREFFLLFLISYFCRSFSIIGSKINECLCCFKCFRDICEVQRKVHDYFAIAAHVFVCGNVLSATNVSLAYARSKISHLR